MMKDRYKIVVVDKKGKFPFLFQGFRKNKYTILRTETIEEFSSNELVSFNLFFVVLYEFRDVFELLLLNTSSSPIIIASENCKILKKVKTIGCFPVVDLSGKVNITNSFHDCIKQILG